MVSGWMWLRLFTRSMTTLEERDRLGEYRAFAEKMRVQADRAATASFYAERRYVRACEFVRELEKEAKCSTDSQG